MNDHCFFSPPRLVGPGLFLGLAWACFTAVSAPTQLKVLVWEKAQDEPVPARLHLQNAQGESVKPPGFPAWDDHFVFPGQATFNLPAGSYSFVLERGPEYRSLSGVFALEDGAVKELSWRLERLVDLPSEGWWSGDLHIHRSPSEIPLLAKAEDLHVVPVITWWNARNSWLDQAPPTPLIRHFDTTRSSDQMAGEDEREGGALLYFNLPEPLPIQQATREYPSPMKFLSEAHHRFPGIHVDVEKPFWWDVPVWVSSGMVDTIGLANNHMCRSRMLENEAWGRPRDPKRWPSPRGNGFWTQEIYYHLLNSGLHLPPSAGSASGVLPNPVGYNRVYVRLDGAFRDDHWWEALRRGRSFVSNGPLLRVQANNTDPGEVFRLPPKASLELALTAQLDTQDNVPAFEIIKNGSVVRRVSVEEWRRTGSLGRLSFQESGWFLVRVIADRADTFRFASTAPWYVQGEDSAPRISRASARFFLDWMDERMQRIQVSNPDQREEVLSYQRTARTFWEERIASANAP